MMINKESYIKKKSHNDSMKNRYDSRRLQNIENSYFYAIMIKNVRSWLYGKQNILSAD